MRVFHDAWRHSDLPRGTVVTIGNYDGIHRGQAAVIDRVVARARALDLAAVVVTFAPHPLEVLEPERAPRRLATAAQKERLIAERGVDALVVVRFDRELAEVPAEAFLDRLLVRKLGMREVLVGSRFVFGRGRRGDLALLEARSAAGGYSVVGMPEVLHDGRPISSTRIREAVAAGRMETARELLGRPYSLAGSVVHGDGRGRRLGWPTANLEPASDLLPADGVYAAGLALEPGDRPLPGVANVGRRPTIEGASGRFVEIHLFDFEGDLYDATVEMALCRRLRGERRFPSLEALAEQIGRDGLRAREYFAAGPCWEKQATGRAVATPTESSHHGRQPR